MIWSFKCRGFPDSLVQKFKARFYLQEDYQMDGKDMFDIHAPVVSWATVGLRLILPAVVGLASEQVDYELHPSTKLEDSVQKTRNHTKNKLGTTIDSRPTSIIDVTPKAKDKCKYVLNDFLIQIVHMTV
jgi:hypothetical protein